IAPRGGYPTAPATGATRVVADDRTASTRVAARPDTRTAPASRPAASRTPRQVPARRPTRAEAGAYARQTGDQQPVRAGRGSRWLAFLAIIAVLAVIVIVAVTISDSTSQTIVHYKAVVSRDLNGAIGQLQHIIDKYTK
ncbi:MAG: hypothetical protein ACRDL5_13150, partial [Solirubrobacteraceae bacterium]